MMTPIIPIEIIPRNKLLGDFMLPNHLEKRSLFQRFELVHRMMNASRQTLMSAIAGEEAGRHECCGHSHGYATLLSAKIIAMLHDLFVIQGVRLTGTVYRYADANMLD